MRSWKKQRTLPEWSLERGTLLLLAVLLLTVPLPWLASALLAASVHELSHVLALKALGHPVTGLSVGVFGARIGTEPLSAMHGLLCALAGPCGVLLLLPFVKWIPTVCLFGAVQSLYNLIPIYPMDGGRALKCLCCLLGLPEAVYGCAELLAAGALLGVGIWAAVVLKMGLLPIAVGLWTVIPGIWRNNSCKPGTFGVQ